MFCIGKVLLEIFALEGFVNARLAWLIPTIRNQIIKYVVFLYVTLCCTRHTFQTTREDTYTRARTHTHIFKTLPSASLSLLHTTYILDD